MSTCAMAIVTRPNPVTGGPKPTSATKSMQARGRRYPGAEKARGPEQGQGVRLVAPQQPRYGFAQKRAVASQRREDVVTPP